MAGDIPPQHPLFRIDGDAPGLPLVFIASGDMVNNFQEAYKSNIRALNGEDGGNASPLTPHPRDMNFDSGQFENLRFVVELFSGMYVNGGQIFSGAAIVKTAETLFKIAMPKPLGGSAFSGGPLVTVSYGNWWRAKGLFERVNCIARGAFDSSGNPTLMTLEMEFIRHFGGQGSGIYTRATDEELRKATAEGFAFKG